MSLLKGVTVDKATPTNSAVIYSFDIANQPGKDALASYIAGRIGIRDKRNKMDKQQQALYDSQTYYTNRMAAWDAMSALLIKAWQDQFEFATKNGDSESLSKSKADTVAENLFSAYYALWIEEWPSSFDEKVIEIAKITNKEAQITKNPFIKSGKIKQSDILG